MLINLHVLFCYYFFFIKNKERKSKSVHHYEYAKLKVINQYGD